MIIFKSKKNVTEKITSIVFSALYTVQKYVMTKSCLQMASYSHWEKWNSVPLSLELGLNLWLA